MIVKNIMSVKFSALKFSDSEDTARQLIVETGASYLTVIGDAGEPLGVKWMTEFTEARSSSVFVEMNPGDSDSLGCRQI